MLLHPPQGELDLDHQRSTFALFDCILAAVTANSAIPTIEDAWRFVLALDGGLLELGESSRATYCSIWQDFARYALAHHVEDLDRVDAELVERFVHAPARTGRRPAASTQRNRIAAIRFLYRSLRPLFQHLADPTLDVRVDGRCDGSVRPLTAEELGRCHHLVDTVVMVDRHLVVVALAESGATTGEIGYVRGSDLRDDHVDLPGDRKSASRSLPLTDWAVGAVARWRIAAEPDPDDFVAVAGAKSYDSRRTSVTHVLRDVIQRAGLGDQHDIEPRSFLATAAARAFAETGRIEHAARTVGFSSLDRTADLIRFDWSAE